MKFPRHAFAEPGLLASALTHRSAARHHNERLEFLGDAVLGFVVADLLYRRFPEMDEGVLTRARASLVNRQSLAALARETELGSHIVLGEGEQRSGGRRRESILANAVEAVIGAVYLDGGIAACTEEIECLFEGRLEALSPEHFEKDPKTRLQELLQARSEPLPGYQTIAVEGSSPNQTFSVECRVSLLELPATGRGRSRRLAEQAAARSALEAIAAAEQGLE